MHTLDQTIDRTHQGTRMVSSPELRGFNVLSVVLLTARCMHYAHSRFLATQGGALASVVR
jgi:hypothetical protein